MTRRKSTARRIPKRHHLYRHWSADGKLLYIGISVDAIRRLQDHYDTADWYDEIAYITIQKFDDRGDLERAEKQAIDDEAPIWNRTGKHKKRKSRPKMTEGAHEVMTIFRDHDFLPIPTYMISLLSRQGGNTLNKMIDLGYLECEEIRGIDWVSITDKGVECSDYWYTQGKQPVYADKWFGCIWDYDMTSFEDGLFGGDVNDNMDAIQYGEAKEYAEWWTPSNFIYLNCGKYRMRIHSPSYQFEDGYPFVEDFTPRALANVSK